MHSVHQDVEDSLRVVFVEHWEDKAALATHFADLPEGRATLVIYDATPTSL